MRREKYMLKCSRRKIRRRIRELRKYQKKLRTHDRLICMPDRYIEKNAKRKQKRREEESNEDDAVEGKSIEKGGVCQSKLDKKKKDIKREGEGVEERICVLCIFALSFFFNNRTISKRKDRGA